MVRKNVTLALYYNVKRLSFTRTDGFIHSKVTKHDDILSSIMGGGGARGKSKEFCPKTFYLLHFHQWFTLDYLLNFNAMFVTVSRGKRVLVMHVIARCFPHSRGQLID